MGKRVLGHKNTPTPFIEMIRRIHILNVFQFLNKFEIKNHTLAGRSANLLIK